MIHNLIHIHIRPNQAQPCNIDAYTQQSPSLMLNSLSEELKSATMADALVFVVCEAFCAGELVQKAVDKFVEHDDDTESSGG